MRHPHSPSSTILAWIKQDVIRVFPAFVFFFVSFQLINQIEELFLRSHGIPTFSFLETTVAAAIIAKVILVIDHLPFANPFPRQPLICNVLWKTALYAIPTMFVRLGIRAEPYFPNIHEFIESIDWGQFIAIQEIYVVLFFTFVTSREFILIIGPPKVYRIFFKKP